MYVLGVDFGGGASKATLMDEKGNIVATATAEYPTFYGDDGKAEQRPDDWYRAACENIRKAIGSLDANQVGCVCFDAATHTAVLTDENFRPVADAVYWTDTRSKKQADWLKENKGDDIFRRFKHCPDTIWTLPQLMWIKENRPDVFAGTKHIMFAKDYVRHLFTGDCVTDYIEAQGSMLFDYDEQAWSQPYLQLLGIDEEVMPRVVTPFDEVGKICKKAAMDSGLKEGTPVICGATDTAMEVLAAGAVKKGDMTVKLATAGRICVVTDFLKADKQLVSYSHIKKGLYYPGTATKSCAASLRWFRDAFGGDYAQFDEMAESVAVGSGGLIFHPYLNGELTPYANPALRGAFTGISSAHTKAHFARAVMEGVAFSLKECLAYLKGVGYDMPARAVLIGGGAKSRLWSGIAADVLGIELLTTQNSDSSLGATMCAGVAAGCFKDIEEAAGKCVKITGEVEPNKQNLAVYDKIYDKYRRIAEFLGSL